MTLFGINCISFFVVFLYTFSFIKSNNLNVASDAEEKSTV